MTKQEDRRPDPKPRKHPLLWQSYLWWNELMQMRKRHKLRLSSIEKGKSNLDAAFEHDVLESNAFTLLLPAAQADMCMHGQVVGPIWDWLVGIKGCGAHTAAKLLALFDDVGKFATTSKFWRFAGWAVIDGEIDRCRKGEKSPYNRRLKSECYLLAEQFIRHQTPLYVDIYYEEKARQRKLHPEKEKINGRWDYTDGHLHRRAMRKMIKRFLSHFWTKWREFEGLSVSQPYAQAILGHTNIQEPPGLEGEILDDGE